MALTLLLCRGSGPDDAQMCGWVFTIYGGLRLCRAPEAPHEQVASHRQRPAHTRLYRRSFNGDPVGASCRLQRTRSNTTRDFLGTFPRELSAFPRAGVTARVEDFTNYSFWIELSPVDLRSQALFSFKVLERAMGIEPTTYSLGRSLT